MLNRQYTHNNTEFKEKERYQDCCGKWCSNEGINLLKIIYIGKKGWFCDSCKDDLIKLGLVEEGE